MKDRIPKDPGRVMISPENGSAPFYATMTRADNPEQEGTPLNKNSLLKDETAALFGLGTDAVPDDVLVRLSGWRQLTEYKAAGSYTFTVPDDVDELGVLVLGGGGSGGATTADTSVYQSVATGGGSGQIKQFVLKKADGDFTNGQSIAVVVGAGGTAVSTTSTATAGKAGGTSSFNGVTANGGPGGTAKRESSAYASLQAGSGGEGQSSDGAAAHSSYGLEAFAIYAPYGLVPYIARYDSDADLYTYYEVRSASPTFGARNIFDPEDLHVYCGAGGAAFMRKAAETKLQPVATRAKGSAGKGAASASAAATGKTATAPGDGGGAVSAFAGKRAKSGAGAAGLVLVYGRKTT